MSSVLKLLKRDWKLYKHSLWLYGIFCTLWPFLILLMLRNWDATSGVNPESILVALYFPAGLMAWICVLSLQAREESNGTLSDLLALPVSRQSIALFRILEFLLVCAFFTLLIILEGIVVLWGSGHTHLLIPKAWPQFLWFGAWFFGVSFLIYLPFVLRWGRRGFFWVFMGSMGLQMIDMKLFEISICSRIPEHPSWPWAGALVLIMALTAFASIKAAEAVEA